MISSLKSALSLTTLTPLQPSLQTYIVDNKIKISSISRDISSISKVLILGEILDLGVWSEPRPIKLSYSIIDDQIIFQESSVLTKSNKPLEIPSQTCNFGLYLMEEFGQKNGTLNYFTPAFEISNEMIQLPRLQNFEGYYSLYESVCGIEQLKLVHIYKADDSLMA